MKTCLLLLFLIAACSHHPSYTLKIDLKGDAEKLYLKSLSEDGKLVVIDSVTLVNGHGKIKGHVEHPDAYFLDFGINDSYQANMGVKSINTNDTNIINRAIIFLENSDITITGFASMLPFAEIRGSVVHEQYMDYLSEVLEKIFKFAFTNQLPEAFGLLDTLINSKLAGSASVDVSGLTTPFAQQAQREISQFYYQLTTEFVKTHANSPIAPTALASVSMQMNADELAQYLNMFGDQFSSMPTVRYLKKQLEKKRQAQ